MIEELFHYLRELNINKLSETDKELHDILKYYANLENCDELIKETYSLVKPDRIWIFDF